jgi:acyl carrier protein
MEAAQGPASSAPEQSTPVSSPDWSEMSTPKILAELEIRLRAILARELGTPASAVGMDQPFPELGLDSMMAMTVLRDAKQLVGIDLSATMLWDHPTISSLAAFLMELLVPEHESTEDDVDLTQEASSNVLDALLDSVESVSAGSEGGI